MKNTRKELKEIKEVKKLIKKLRRNNPIKVTVKN